MQVRLVVTNKASNDSSSCDLALEEKITIGRHLGSPVVLQGDRLSRHHFSLMVIDEALTVEDHSSNGTWLNGALLKEQMSAQVKSGDIIEIPGYEMQVMVRNKEEPQKAQTEGAVPVPSKERGPTWKEPKVAALRVLEPREAALLLFAVASFALISFFLNR